MQHEDDTPPEVVKFIQSSMLSASCLPVEMIPLASAMLISALIESMLMFSTEYDVRNFLQEAIDDISDDRKAGVNVDHLKQVH